MVFGIIVSSHTWTDQCSDYSRGMSEELDLWSFLLSVQWILAALASWDSQLCLFNSGKLWGSSLKLLPVSWSRNSHKAISWGNHSACCLSPNSWLSVDHHLMSRGLKPLFYVFGWGSCFRWDYKSVSCYSILARSGSSSPFTLKMF